MQANDMLEYKDKIIDAFKNGIFLSGHLKTSDDAAHGHVLEDVKNFIQKIESMSEKINLNLFEDFFESQSPVIYAKMLINTENPDKNKEFVAEIEDRISDLKDRRKKMSKTKQKNAAETLEIINEILDYNKNAQKNFQLPSKVNKGKSELKTEESIAERVKSENEKIAEIKKKKKILKKKI